MLSKPMAFTTKSKQGLLPRLMSAVTLINNSDMVQALAQWDTGATGTCISSDMVKQLHLTPTGKQSIRTPSGTSTVNTYLISIVLPNAVTIKDVTVCDSEIGAQGLGVLIGMDIITLGDFALSNFNGTTTFTFRMPSMGETDYVKEANAM